MMQTDQRILLVGTPSERLSRLCCIFEFLGEQIEIVAIEKLSICLQDTRFRALVVTADNMPADALKSLASQYHGNPFCYLAM